MRGHGKDRRRGVAHFGFGQGAAGVKTGGLRVDAHFLSPEFAFPEGKAPFGRSLPGLSGGMASDIPPDRGGGHSPPHGGERDCQAAWSGRLRIFSGPLADWRGRSATFTGRLTGPVGDVMGGNKHAARNGPRYRMREQPPDKRSLPQSAETAEGRLRASGIERGRPTRAVAHR